MAKYIKILLLTAALAGFASPAFAGVQSSSTFSVTVGVVDTGEGGGVNPPPPPPPPVAISNIVVSSLSFNSAFVSWNTNVSASCEMLFGKTTAYETGNNFTSGASHSVALNNLDAQSIYHYKIICSNPSSGLAQTGDQTFATLSAQDLTPPPNIFGFSAQAGNGQIVLNWQTPADADFNRLRIYRSTSFYPQNPGEGVLIYDADGASGSYQDSGLQNNTAYYYTAFSYDLANNGSSGAIAGATPFASGEPEIPPILPPVISLPFFPGGGGSALGGQQTTTELVNLPGGLAAFTQEEARLIKEVGFQQFSFIQDRQIKAGEAIKLEAGKMLELSMDMQGLTQAVKKIIVVFEKDGKTFSFLLRLEAGEKFLSDVVVPEDKTGVYKVSLLFFDKASRLIKKISGEIEVLKPSALPAPLASQNILARVSAAAMFVWSIWWIRMFLFISLVLTLVLLNERQKKSESDMRKVRRINID